MRKINLKIVQKITVIAILICSFSLQGQNKDNSNFTRDGFIFEFSIGGGIITLEDSFNNQSISDTQGAFSFPDLKFGYMLNEKLAVTLSVPGMIYDTGEFDRHFGALIPSVQYWVKDKWWIHGGVGLAIDGPALYDMKDNRNDDWNTGLGFMASSGYEVYRKKNFALNVQSKIVFGGVKLENEIERGAVQLSVGLGFSWL